jgi:signal transduction histidine kinase
LYDYTKAFEPESVESLYDELNQARIDRLLQGITLPLMLWYLPLGLVLYTRVMMLEIGGICLAIQMGMSIASRVARRTMRYSLFVVVWFSLVMLAASIFFAIQGDGQNSVGFLLALASPLFVAWAIRERWLIRLLLVLVTAALILDGWFFIPITWTISWPLLVNLVLVCLDCLIVMFAIHDYTFQVMHRASSALKEARTTALYDNFKDQLIASVNHEIRTPLMALRTWMENIADAHDCNDYGRVGNYLPKAMESLSRLIEIVDQLLSALNDQGVGEFDPEPVNVHDTLLEAVELLQKATQAMRSQSREIQLLVPANLLIRGERSRLCRVLINLLSNAMKYSPPDDPEEPEKRITVTAWQDGNCVQVVVRDYGRGIPPGQQEILFQRFTRLPRDIASGIRGTGMGLYLCRRMVEAMGGSIWVESDGIEGEGSSFIVRLPTAQPALVLS